MDWSGKPYQRMLVLLCVATTCGLLAPDALAGPQKSSGTGFIAQAAPGSAGDTTADGVLGQANFVQGVQNFRDSRGVNTSGSGVAVDKSVSPNRVLVVDTSNNRVLGWTNISAYASHAPANIVIGQPDFFSGDCNLNGSPTASTLCAPTGLTVDNAGRLYVADAGNNRVLEYDGPFTTDRVADDVFGQFGNLATNTCNALGAISANSLCNPTGVGTDGSDNLYVADTDNNRVLEYHSPETVTGTPGSGDFVADKVFGQLGSLTTGVCNVSGINNAGLCGPFGVTADSSGNVYIADTNNNRVLEYTTPLTTNTNADRVFGQLNNFAGNLCNNGGTSVTSLCQPQAVETDSSGNLYVADTSNHRVLEYNTPVTLGTTADRVFGQNNSFTTHVCAVGANALCLPSGLCTDSADSLYVADSGNNRNLSFTTPITTDTIADGVLNQSLFTTNAQNKVDNLGIDTPSGNNSGIAIDKSVVPNRVYAVDVGNNRVLGWNNVSAFTTHAGANLVIGQPNSFTSAPNNGGVKASTLNFPTAVAVDSAGNLYVADSNNSRVLEYNTPFTSGVTADKVFGQSGSFTTHTCITPVSADTLCFPVGVAIDSSGNVYISDTLKNRILEYDTPLSTNTTADRVFGQINFTDSDCNKNQESPSSTSLCLPAGLAVDTSNNLYVADSGNNRALKYNTPIVSGTVADKVFGQLGSFFSNAPNQGGLSANSLNSPEGVAVDGLGNVYISDLSNNRVLKFNAPGDTTADKVFGQAGQFNHATCLPGPSANSVCPPDGVATDSSNNLYVVDAGFSRILMYLAP